MIEWKKIRQLHLNSAEGYMLLGMLDEALSEVEKVLDNDPEDLAARELKCIFLAQMQKYDEAEKNLLKLIKIQPGNPDLFVQLAFIKRRTEGLDTAINAIKKALEINPDMAIANYNIACYYCLQNKIEQAFYHLEKAIRIDAFFAEEARKDEDFNSIKNDEQFKQIIQRSQNNKNQEN